jgi:hypothetical protein
MPLRRYRTTAHEAKISAPLRPRRRAGRASSGPDLYQCDLGDAGPQADEFLADPYTYRKPKTAVDRLRIGR